MELSGRRNRRRRQRRLMDGGHGWRDRVMIHYGPPKDDQPKRKYVKDFLLEYLPCKHKCVL